MDQWIQGAGAFGVKPSEFAVLAVIEANQNVSSIDISKALNIALPNVVALIGRMSRQGFVFRRTDPIDRRRQILQLTPEGLSLVANLGDAVKAADAGITKNLSSIELRMLKEVLLKLRNL